MKEKMIKLIALTKVKAILVAMVAIVGAFILQYGGSVQQVVNPPVNKSLGALAGPDIPSPYLNWGGIAQWGLAPKSLIQASSTICSLQSPAATSTLISASVTLNLASSTALEDIDFTQNLTPGATASTSRRFGSDLRIPISQGGTYLASTTDSTLTIFPPNTMLNIDMASILAGNHSGNVPVGFCQARWEQNSY